MIRFIDIGDQIIDDEKYFAWYDTIIDRFIEINGYQVFESWKDFEDEYLTSPLEYPLERFKSLFPKDRLDK